MSDKCSCMELEEKIYWTHFQSVQFLLMLSGNDQAALPEKFVNHFREKLGKLVYLQIPSGAKWHVGLVVDRGSLCFKLGWREFMEENSLQKGDTLMLKYSGSMGFDVLLFDRDSSCEREVSYFVKKCEHTTNKPREMGKTKDKETARERTTYKPREEGNSKDKETVKEPSDRRTRERPSKLSVDAQEHYEESVQVRSESSNDGCTEWNPSKRAKNDDIVTPNYARRQRASGKIQEKHNNSTPLVLYPSSQVGGSVEVGIEKGDILQMSDTRSRYRRPLEFLSNRRWISEEEKRNVKLMAEKESSESDVVVTMKEYQVYRDFFLTIPSWWVDENLPPENVEVSLQVGTKSWKVSYWKRTTGGMLRHGWREFALDNCLEEHDACLFKLVDKEMNPILIDVKIFHVVDEVVPPTLISSRRKPLPKSRRKWQ